MSFCQKILLLIRELQHNCSLQKWRQLNCAEGLNKCWNFIAKRGEGKDTYLIFGLRLIQYTLHNEISYCMEQNHSENLIVSSTKKKKNLHLVQPKASPLFSQKPPLSRSWAICTQSSTIHSVYSRSILILIFCARLNLNLKFCLYSLSKNALLYVPCTVIVVIYIHSWTRL
jgi:hypothetical protein